ncbi:hypothetical protein GCM10027085_11700 [Spirosoma aerophilum]
MIGKGLVAQGVHGKEGVDGLKLGNYTAYSYYLPRKSIIKKQDLELQFNEYCWSESYQKGY